MLDCHILIQSLNYHRITKYEVACYCKIYFILLRMYVIIVVIGKRHIKYWLINVGMAVDSYG